MRATPRKDRDGRSPYEMVTGLRPQGPIDHVYEKIRYQRLAPEEYVRDLAKHVKIVVDRVSSSLEAEYKKRLEKLNVENAARNNRQLEVGDLVLLRKPSSHGWDGGEGRELPVSKRLQPFTWSTLYKVHKFVGPTVVILADPDTGDTHSLGFKNPIHISRLVPLDLQELETPIDIDTELWIEIKSPVSYTHLTLPTICSV